MKLIEKVSKDLRQAAKDRDRLRQAVLRMLLAALETESKRKGGMDEDKALAIVKSEVKKRKEAIEAFKKAEADERVKQEKGEMKILLEYLPEQVGEDEVREVVKSIVEKMGGKEAVENRGPVIGQVVGRIGSEKVDGKLAAKVVGEYLS